LGAKKIAFKEESSRGSFLTEVEFAEEPQKAPEEFLRDQEKEIASIIDSLPSDVREKVIQNRKAALAYASSV
jgi:DNA-directed RNA polymerase specialized sigma24 family protein